MECKTKITREQLPESLDPIHIQNFLNIGRKKTYEFLQNPPFHVVKVGRLIKVPREAFLKWFDGDSEYEIIQRDKMGIAIKMKWNERTYTLQYH